MNGTTTHDSANLQVREEGFTEVSAGGQRPVIDIVFVHGLGGHPKSTWTSQHRDAVEETQQAAASDARPPPESSNDSRRRLFGLGRSKKAKDERQTGLFWPLQLLAKDFPDARILTYGYDSSVVKLFQAADRRGIISHGNDLLNALEDRRMEAKERPIIFVVHSLGGLILKRALWASRDSTDDKRKVFENTIGILFFGTPHRGGNYVDLGEVIVHMVKATGHSASPQILTNLRQDSEMLEVLRTEFLRMLDENSFDIHSFYETKGVSGYRLVDRKVVDKTSAVLEHRKETARGASGNHSEICKFTGPKDNRYEAVKNIIQRFVNSERVSRSEEIEKCKASLEVNEMNNDNVQSRFHSITERYKFTLSWLFQDVVVEPNGRERRHEFVPWLNEKKGMFWIRGIPASGKSTAMKYIYNHLSKDWNRHRGDPWLLVAVFFHDRGTTEQKTTLGMLRSILRQLLLDSKHILHELVPLIAPFRKIDQTKTKTSKKDDSNKDDWHWTVDGLRQAILAVTSYKNFKKKVFLIVDALDEHNGDQKGMIEFFRGLVALSEPGKVTFQILLSSRPDPEFRILLSGYPSLDIHEWTESDVRTFVNGSFQDDMTFEETVFNFHDREALPNLKETIVRRARGVFLWVRLVIEDILDQVKRRKIADIAGLSARLAALPDDLEDLYTRILQRVPRTESRECYILLEAVLRARRPLTVLELAYVLHLALDKTENQLDELNSSKPRLDQEKIDSIGQQAWSYLDRIMGCCKGLLQIYGRHSEHPWLDERASLWSMPAFEGLIPRSLPRMYTDEATDELAERPGISDIIRRGTVASTFSNDIALPPHDVPVPNGVSPEAHYHVQLLHQSVKEYLLKHRGRNLDHLFQREHLSDSDCGDPDGLERPTDNGHVYILDFCVQFLRSSELNPGFTVVMKDRNSRPLLTQFTIAQWVLHHGVGAETTMNRSFMSTLDTADHFLQIVIRTEAWPARVTGHDTIADWNFNFIAYAIGANMYHYVQDKLRHQPDLLDKKTGRPLLFFAVWTPGNAATTEPRMVQLLLDHGANVREQWVDGEGNKKDALRSMQYHVCDSSGYPQKEIMLLLLEKGADPDLLVIDRWNRRPLTHQVIMASITAESKMEILKALKRSGADFSAKDTNKLNVLDLYCQRLLERTVRYEFSITDLRWILEAGARITAGMFRSDGFKGTLLYAPELRQKEYYTFEGQAFASKDNPQWPGFSYGRRYIRMMFSPSSQLELRRARARHRRTDSFEGFDVV